MNFRMRSQTIFNQNVAVMATASQGQTTVQIPITREFFLEKLRVTVTFDFTLGTLTGGFTDTHGNILQRARLIVTDGGEQKTVVDVSGTALLDKSLNAGKTDIETTAVWGLAFANATARRLCYNIPLTPDGLEGTLSQFFLLPLPRYNADPILELTFAGQANLATTPGTAVYANFNILVEAYKREVPDITFQVYSHELVELSQAFTSTGANQQFFLQTPGAFTSIMMRPFDAAQQNRLATVYGVTGEVELNVLDVRLRKHKWFELCSLNQESWNVTALPVAVNGLGPLHMAIFDFLSDEIGVQAENLGGLLETNELAFTGVRPVLLNTIAVAGVVKFTTHRVFGDISPLKPMLVA